MKKPPLPPPTLQRVAKPIKVVPSAEQLGLDDDYCVQRQIGGRSQALALVKTFLEKRGQQYTKKMSSPTTAFESCSRLSPYITFGCISMREVFHAVAAKERELFSLSVTQKNTWPGSLRSFSSRLRWHCHFIQKLEDQPSMEFVALHPAHHGIRPRQYNQHFLNAWKTGHTGFPMIDACMRCLMVTGWLNFRMRAMLISFASHHLWLHWQEPALHLARLFTDYEPGIHYSQIQMQSGSTGINTIRIYNPIKQGIEQDPNGKFIRAWIPELENVPDEFIHTPWDMDQPPCDYPAPIIDEGLSRKAAADILYGLKKGQGYRDAAQKIVEKHTGRKKAIPSAVEF